MSNRISYRFFLVMALAIATLFAITSRVTAHTVELVKSDPPAGTVLDDSPAQVQAWFNEEMETKVSTMKVYNSSGNQVDLGDGGVDLNDADHASMIVNLQAALPPDAYIVRWHVVLLDGDASDGDFQFFVGQAAATAAAGKAIAAPVSAPSDPQTAKGGSSTILILGGGGGLLLVLALGFLLVRDNRRS